MSQDTKTWLVYEGWEEMKLAPRLVVNMDKQSRTYGWLMTEVNGKLVTLGDIKPIAKEMNKKQYEGRRPYLSTYIQLLPLILQPLGGLKYMACNSSNCIYIFDYNQG